MSTQINDGGPAFPTSQRVPENYMDEAGYGRCRTVTMDVGGMTLREYLAGQAMAGILAHPQMDYAPFAPKTYAAVVASAYRMADAMIAARK